MEATLTVAPREIRDLVYRASRVAGCDTGAAERIARHVAFAEMHHGAAVQAFCSALETGALATSPWVSGPDAVSAAEIEARRCGSASLTFEPAAPLASIAATLMQCSERGVVADAAGADANAHGGTEVAAVEMRLAGQAAVSARQARLAKARDAAHRHGIAVERDWFGRLEAAAAAYLVAESTLDEIDFSSSDN